ncbi:MAG TPA: hypothetical protein DC054_10735 [Blastocatellia bacterium]|nr:hypothetical protein [Blastocatellia bacterium]
MARDRTTQREPAAAPRRPAVSATAERTAAENRRSPAQALQQRLGNQGTQALLARQSPAAQEATGKAKPKSAVAAKQPSATLPEVTVTATGPLRSERIIELIKILEGRLETATSVTRTKLLVGQIKALLISLESAPIWPTPKRDFVAGPFKFSEYVDNFYDFGFLTMNDKHWSEGWKAVYSLVLSRIGPVMEICDLFLATTEEEQNEVVADIVHDDALERIGEKVGEKSGLAVGKQMLKWGTSLRFAKGSAGLIKVLGKGVPWVIAGYDLYKANTEGPSPHEAALETTAMIMGKVYGKGFDDSGREIGGGFIPTMTNSICRVARHPFSPPFPHHKNRKEAFDWMANRIYERMRNLIAPKHIATADAFYAFRKKMMDNAENIAAAAGAELTARNTRLVYANEKELREMEDLAALWQQTKVDTTKPFQVPTYKTQSDAFSGIGSATKQRYGLKDPPATASPSSSPVSSETSKKTGAEIKDPRKTSAVVAVGSGSTVDQLKAQIVAGKITFDSLKFKKDLLGENTVGANVTELLQKLVLELSNRATIRISSVVRSEGHHGSGRAVDVGNEGIAGTLLPALATDATVKQFSIDELIFDANVAGKDNRNEWNYDQGKKHNYNKKTLDDHKDHIHFAVKPG